MPPSTPRSPRCVRSVREPAWRDYRSAAFHVDLLRKEGFEVEAGSATMPTAFRARRGRGRPVLAT